jgi:ATP-binding cassette subfamily B protein
VLAWLELTWTPSCIHPLAGAGDRPPPALQFSDGRVWQEWTYGPDLQLKHHDHAGVGTLEL